MSIAKNDYRLLLPMPSAHRGEDPRQGSLVPTGDFLLLKKKKKKGHGLKTALHHIVKVKENRKICLDAPRDGFKDGSVSR